MIEGGMVKTRWISGPYFDMRYVGPMWVAVLAVMVQDMNLSPRARKGFKCMAKLTGAHWEVRAPTRQVKLF